jgi:hypothetical protein
MAKQQKRGSGGNKKHGRSTRTPIRKMKHDQSWDRTEKNRKLKRMKHIKKYPNDLQTKSLLDIPN